MVSNFKKIFCLDKLIAYGLYLFAFLLPIQTRWIIKAGVLNNGYWEYGTISLYVTDILLLVSLFIFVVLFIKKRTSDCRLAAIWWIIAGLELAVFISIWVAADKKLAVYFYGRFLLALGLFYLLVSVSYNRLKLIYIFLSSVLVQAVLGILQFFEQATTANKWLGLAAHSPTQLGTSVVETLSSGRWLRAYGSLDHPNMLGALLVVGILFLISLFLTEKKIWGKFFLFYFLFLTFLLALFFTFSRGAWIGLLVGLLVMFVTILARRDLGQQKRLLKVVLIGFLLIFILFHFYSDLILTRLSANTRLEVKSNVERIASYRTASEIIKRHWLCGVGVGNYTLAVYNELNSCQSSWYYQPVHNTYLLVWSEIGLLGIFSFLALLFFSVYYCFISYFKIPAGRKIKDRHKLTPATLGILSALIVMMSVDHFFWSLHFGLFFFWFILGVSIKENKR